MSVRVAGPPPTKPPPPARATPKSQNLMETTLTVALTRSLLAQEKGGGSQLCSTKQPSCAHPFICGAGTRPCNCAHPPASAPSGVSAPLQQLSPRRKSKQTPMGGSLWDKCCHFSTDRPPYPRMDPLSIGHMPGNVFALRAHCSETPPHATSVGLSSCYWYDVPPNPYIIGINDEDYLAIWARYP